MPYTPPSNRSPASSASTSPDVSRRSSIVSSSRPALPKSASYLNKHRRTPSVTTLSDASSPSPAAQLEINGVTEEPKAVSVNGLSTSIRKSPPPITDIRAMPNGAIISPPDSGSDDDERLEIRGRRLGQLKDLRDAVSQLSQSKASSPERTSVAQQAPEEPSTPRGMHISFSTSSLSSLPKSGRRISHVRSATESDALDIMASLGSSVSLSDESDEDLKYKPQMVRKKSGELVRPALRPAANRRPSSMPGTPVFSKAVHFDSHLEHVRHFLQVDRPLAVSAGSSPVENYDSDTEYPFPGSNRTTTKSPPFEWELVTTNFPHDSPSHADVPVRVERVWLSADQKSMLGSVAVANLAFQKSVTCRFTLDYWKTTSEVNGEYSHEIRPRETPLGQDRFQFSIKLSDTINLESKTLFFCIRYNVNNQEFWDNNNSANFQVDFKKKHLPQNGKNNFQGAASRPLNGLPRSNRRQNPSSAPRPVSMPVFGNDTKFDFDQPIHEFLGESDAPTGLRFKSKSTNNLASDNLANGLTSPSGAAFANRYDFGASLSAAVQAAKEPVAKELDTLYMKGNVRSPPSGLAASPNIAPSTGPVQTPVVAPSSTLGLASSSYEELVNKYCFFGSKQPSPIMRDGTIKNASVVANASSKPTGSSTGRHTGPAAHHGLSGLHLNSRTLGFSTDDNYTLSAPLSLPSPMSIRDQSTTPKTPGSARSLSPAFPSVAGAASSDMPYFTPQLSLLSDRFPWCGDTHAATIRG